MQKKASKTIAGKQDTGFQHFLLFSFFLFFNFGNDCKNQAIFYVLPLCFLFYLRIELKLFNVLFYSISATHLPIIQSFNNHAKHSFKKNNAGKKNDGIQLVFLFPHFFFFFLKVSNINDKINHIPNNFFVSY